MKIILFLLIPLLILAGCTDPSSSATSPRDCNDIIKSLSLEYQTPSDRVISRADIANGNTGYAEQEFNALMGTYKAQDNIEILQYLIGNTTVPQGGTVSFSGGSITTTGGTLMNVTNGGKVKVSVNGNTATLYAELLGMQPFQNNNTILADILMQIKIEGGTSALTDYTKISIWVELGSFKHKIIADATTGNYNRYDKPGDMVTGMAIDGEVTSLGINNSGIFYHTIRNSNESSAAFGDNSRLVIKDVDANATTYIIGDTVTDSASVNGTDRSFLDTGLADNLPAASWTAATATGTAYDDLFGSSGTFDTEFQVSSQL